MARRRRRSVFTIVAAIYAGDRVTDTERRRAVQHERRTMQALDILSDGQVSAGLPTFQFDGEEWNDYERELKHDLHSSDPTVLRLALRRCMNALRLSTLVDAQLLGMNRKLERQHQAHVKRPARLNANKRADTRTFVGRINRILESMADPDPKTACEIDLEQVHDKTRSGNPEWKPWRQAVARKERARLIRNALARYHRNKGQNAPTSPRK
jgi:hypothetical protein